MDHAGGESLSRASDVDLGHEVAEVRCAVEGVRVMADTLAYDGAPDPETARLMPRRISAVLNLIVARVRLVEAVLKQSRDPVELQAHHNTVVGPEGTHLRAWSPALRQQEAQRQLRRVAAEQRTTKRRSRK